MNVPLAFTINLVIYVPQFLMRQPMYYLILLISELVNRRDQYIRGGQ